MVAYQRIEHAGHYGRGIDGIVCGHDLEQWDVAAPVRPLRPDGVPVDAEYHSGYVKDGVQHWLFIRVAALSPGECDWCKAL